MYQQTQFQTSAENISSSALFSTLLGQSGDLSLEEKLQRLFSYRRQGMLNLISLNQGELVKLFGFDQQTAAALKAFVELSGRLTRSVRFPGMSMTDSETVASYYMEFLCHRTKEMVVAAFFDQKYRFIADEVHSVGSDCASIVSVREIFRSALRANAAHVILLHNHPSGDPAPSREDLDITGRVAEAGKIMNVSLTDHIIIGDHCYYSFKEKRLLE